jgi:hypothetical protein
MFVGQSGATTSVREPAGPERPDWSDARTAAALRTASGRWGPAGGQFLPAVGKSGRRKLAGGSGAGELAGKGHWVGSRTRSLAGSAGDRCNSATSCIRARRTKIRCIVSTAGPLAPVRHSARGQWSRCAPIAAPLSATTTHAPPACTLRGSASSRRRRTASGGSCARNAPVPPPPPAPHTRMSPLPHDDTDARRERIRRVVCDVVLNPRGAGGGGRLRRFVTLSNRERETLGEVQRRFVTDDPLRQFFERDRAAISGRTVLLRTGRYHPHRAASPRHSRRRGEAPPAHFAPWHTGRDSEMT